MSKKAEIEIVIEELEALRMVNDFKTMLADTNPLKHFGNDLELHIMAKDCALLQVDRILQLHITKDHNNHGYWLLVKEYIQQL